MGPKIPTIFTDHLSLRPWNPEDSGALVTILQEKDILYYFPDKSPLSREKVDRYIAHHLAHWAEFGYGHWAVISREDGHLLGWNGLEYLPEINETEVAYLLSRQVWGRGYATEAALAAVHYGFEQARLDVIVGLVHPENVGSVRVLEKCGLTFVDQLTLWGLEMSRYRLLKVDFDRLSASPQP